MGIKNAGRYACKSALEWAPVGGVVLTVRGILDNYNHNTDIPVLGYTGMGLGVGAGVGGIIGAVQGAVTKDDPRESVVRHIRRMRGNKN
jgi:hypothetical protein